MEEVNMYNNQVILIDDIIKILHLNHFTDVIRKDLDDKELTDYLHLKCNLSEILDELSEDLIQTTTLSFVSQDIDIREYNYNNIPQYFAMSRNILTIYKKIDCNKFMTETFTWLINGKYVFARNRNQKILKVLINRYHNMSDKKELGINIESVEKIYKML